MPVLYREPVLINAGTPTNSGAIQASERLDVQISNSLTGLSGGKVTSNGELALSALTLSNSGQWIAQNLTLDAGSLTNNGEITGVDALAVTLNQALNNQGICYGTSSGNVSASGENVTQSGKSVTDQSGIYAGKGGFDITVGNHTQLDGAVIASTATDDKNKLDTGTLGWSDIHNESKTSGDSYTVAISGSAGGSGSGENRNVAPAIGTGHAEESSSGTIIIRDKDNQTQDIADLSRDTDNAHHGVDVNGDVQKVKDNLAVQSEGAALATSVLDAYGKYAEQKAKESNAALEAKLTAEGKMQGETAQEREAFLKTQPGYQSTDYGPGSEFWTKGSAAAGLLAGALGGNLKAGAAAGAAPLLAELVSKQDDPTLRAVLHGIVAQASGGSGSDGMKAGAIGAITASAMTDHLVSALYGKDVSQLTADEKRLVSSLVTIAGGLAGAASTDGDLSMAAIASSTAKVEVENNSLGDGWNSLLSTGERDYVDAAASWKQFATTQGLSPEETQAGLDKIAKGELPEGANIAKVIVEGYQDGVMIAGAWYLGPAASVGKMVSGGVIAEIANGSYQWFDLSQPGNENKSWDWKSSASSGIAGMLAPGRTIGQNVGIAMGGAFFTDGPNTGSIGGAAIGAWFGGKFGEFAPFPGEVNDLIGGIGGEVISNKIKDKVSENEK